ncbi:hypothetical protein M0R45_037781 [Rubus argutus]|uniref:Retrotransposon gag domain-containing protein n=1 Tax=Rubus argutus TaxID=59490 RepID=A0AAW1W118_RUBAR
MRGPHDRPPSITGDDPPTPPRPPNSSLASSSTPPISSTSTTPLVHFQNQVDTLHAQNQNLQSSLETLTRNHLLLQSQITDQFASLQQSIQATLLQQSPPHPPSPFSSPHHSFSSPHLSFSSPHPSLSFGRIPINTTTWNGLGLSNPPSPTPHTVDPQNSTATTAIYTTTTPLYSTITSIPNQFPSSTSFPSYTPFSRFPTPTSFRTEPPSYKPPKVDLPRFNGDDVVGWLAMAERYIRSQRIPLHERVFTIASHFGPDASVWMNSFEQRHPNPTWDSFVAALLEHFGSGSSADFKASLSHLQQTSTVDEFITSFTKLSCRAPDWIDEQLLPIFCGGLKTDIRFDVLAMEPDSLAAAQRLARRYESKLNAIRAARAQRPSSWTYSPRPSNGPHYPTSSTASTTSQSQPLQPSSSSCPTLSNTQQMFRPRSAPPPRRWSPTEHNSRRARGLCFSCDEQWSPTHSCKKPIMAILECPTPPDNALETSEESETPEGVVIEPDPLYPLHAITNTSIGEMMRFQGTINTTPINIFIDCGSAMNFLNPSIAHLLGILISPAASFHFTTASGHSLSPSGIVHNITVAIQGYEFTGSFLLLPVAGCDLLLGAQWLDTLGFIGWHFAEKVMVFTAQGKCHILQGSICILHHLIGHPYAPYCLLNTLIPSIT